ncbi:MAG: hypothetical protein H0T89_29535 [Deltaproteobacteria bacterium]|nr:hypothetical protein [Deltaproteobacteria bacterium]MDQ3301040.1 hypothetical protein [Myxococcota bacterium]
MLSERFDRLAAIRGDMVKGLPVTAWAANLGDLDRDLLMRAAIAAIRELVLPEWESTRPEDRRPQEALEATEAWLAKKDADSLLQTKATAKACTAARGEFFGTDHRVPEAARALAWAAGAKENDLEHIWDALVAIEQELLARIALVSEYQKAPEQRRAIIAVLRRMLEPPAAEEAGPDLSAPVPYSASGNFVVGQKVTHVKFGDLVVTAAGDKWIDVQLPDGTTKRLAQKPK